MVELTMSESTHHPPDEVTDEQADELMHGTFHPPEWNEPPPPRQSPDSIADKVLLWFLIAGGALGPIWFIAKLVAWIGDLLSN